MSFRIHSNISSNAFSDGNRKNAVSLQGLRISADIGNSPIGYVLTWNGIEWVTTPGGGGGGTGTTGPTGPTGNSLLNGVVNPTTEGVNGDFYINTISDEIFGPKTSGSWGGGTSIIGPTGATGTGSGTDSTYVGPDGVVQLYESTGVVTGSPDFKFVNNQLLIPNGSDFTPSLAFVDNIDTGVYLSSNKIGFSINGSNSIEIKDDGVFQNGSSLDHTYGVNRNPLINDTGRDLVISAGAAGTGINLQGGDLKLRSGIS